MRLQKNSTLLNTFTLIFWGNGNTLNELKAFDPFVKVNVNVCAFPTVKSLNSIV